MQTGIVDEVGGAGGLCPEFTVDVGRFRGVAVDVTVRITTDHLAVLVLHGDDGHMPRRGGAGHRKDDQAGKADQKSHGRHSCKKWKGCVLD